jgi:hypothetical protein
MNFKKILILAAAAFTGEESFAQSTTATNNYLGAEFLGSSTNMNVDFKANNTQWMRLTPAGNFGIGTTTPQTTLHVKGHGLFTTATGAPTTAPYILAKNGFSVAGLADYTWYADVNTGIFHPVLRTIGFTTGGQERMRITSTGFIGVGTNAPTAMFSVNNGAIKLTGIVPGFGGPQILWGGNTTTAPNGEWGLECLEGSSTDGLNFWRPSGASGSGGNYVMFLSNTSKVGINTGNPTAQLTVNGNMLVGDPTAVTLPAGYKLYVQTGILTEKVHVAIVNSAAWADYVFDGDYKLKTIAEVDAFVKENKHLPGVPSAMEVAEKGIDMAEMDAKLLEKIEELTLYIIEQNKRIDQLEKRCIERQ